MDTEGPPSVIRIVAPIEKAWHTMIRALFKPFDFNKWLCLGFCAWLAHLGSGGTSFNFNVPSEFKAKSTNMPSMPHIDWGSGLVIGIIVGIVIFVAALWIVFVWLSSRGKFLFIDGVVHDRGVVVQPWREYRADGNRLFLFRLALIAAWLVLFLAAGGIGYFAFIAIGGAGTFSGGRLAAPQIAAIVTAGVVLIALIFLIGIIELAVEDFITPILYHRRCRPMEAVRAFLDLARQHPGEFLLYLLFRIALGFGLTVVAFIAICATCCIAALPYIGTVILLPVYTLIRAYPLHFLAQFGEAWNVFPAPQPPDSLPPPAEFNAI